VTIRWLFVVAVTACAVPDGHPPVARISATPPGVLENDGFQTVVTLDASASSDPIDDPEGTSSLDYAWEILGDEVMIDEGDLTDPTLVVRFRGDRPPTVKLTVTDEDGIDNTASLQILLTVTP
jgi:hypothetical protein